ncbi:MAG: magnesium/cobalt transporter CorA [Candidatus Aminicenantes bacterium]|nr:magnesium/cobalt transporter CorA [Candidatus Aminicenantes bacterium]
MGRNSNSRAKKTGLSSGSLVHVGRRKIDRPRITILDYDAERVYEKVVDSIDECFPFHQTATVTWINVDGVHDPDVVEKIGKTFRLHPLILEDIMTTSQRPKLDELDEAFYIVARMVDLNERKTEVITEQLSLVFGKNFVLTFQEEPGDMFDSVRERIRGGKARVRKLGPDYLAYALLDAVVDHYFVVLENVGDRIEKLEEELIRNPQTETLHAIHTLKREMLLFRKAVWPLREVVAGIERQESPLVRAATNIFFRDVYDHIIQVIDNAETYRDILAGMLETYLSSMSNRMNQVMKLLTIISTIFIPLTFIAGVYGMNFVHMPELKWKYGYFVVWGIMIVVGLGLVRFFKRKKWL